MQEHNLLPNGIETIRNDLELEPWENLRVAIVIQAVEDYRSCLRVLRHGILTPRDKPYALMKDELEQFFQGWWFDELAYGIPGEQLMREIKKQMGWNPLDESKWRERCQW